MLSKLIALGLIAANPTPLASKVAYEKWVELGAIPSISPAKINAVIVDVWPGLTINDFKWIEDYWWQHDDKAYEWHKPQHLQTTFYERKNYY